MSIRAFVDTDFRVYDMPYGGRGADESILVFPDQARVAKATLLMEQSKKCPKTRIENEFSDKFWRRVQDSNPRGHHCPNGFQVFWLFWNLVESTVTDILVLERENAVKPWRLGAAILEMPVILREIGFPKRAAKKS